MPPQAIRTTVASVAKLRGDSRRLRDVPEDPDNRPAGLPFDTPHPAGDKGEWWATCPGREGFGIYPAFDVNAMTNTPGNGNVNKCKTRAQAFIEIRKHTDRPEGLSCFPQVCPNCIDNHFGFQCREVDLLDLA